MGHVSFESLSICIYVEGKEEVSLVLGREQLRFEAQFLELRIRQALHIRPGFALLDKELLSGQATT
jgi:hypothetical protein